MARGAPPRPRMDPTDLHRVRRLHRGTPPRPRMDPVHPVPLSEIEGCLHAHADGSSVPELVPTVAEVSPRARGWIRLTITVRSYQAGASTRTRMDPLTPQHQDTEPRCLPAHADGSTDITADFVLDAVPPCARGWIRLLFAVIGAVGGTSPRPRMDPPCAAGKMFGPGCLPAPADGSLWTLWNVLTAWAPPCARGWILEGKTGRWTVLLT
jgi:hypothetical protein